MGWNEGAEVSSWRSSPGQREAPLFHSFVDKAVSSEQSGFFALLSSDGRCTPYGTGSISVRVDKIDPASPDEARSYFNASISAEGHGSGNLAEVTN